MTGDLALLTRPRSEVLRAGPPALTSPLSQCDHQSLFSALEDNQGKTTVCLMDGETEAEGEEEEACFVPDCSIQNAARESHGGEVASNVRLQPAS